MTQGPYRRSQRAGLVGGAVAFLVLSALPAPEGLEGAAWRTAAVAVLMAVWWMSEAVPIPVTALLPVVLFPTLGVLPMAAATAPYAHELIFLFMGGFFLAAAMERWGLHRRIALAVLLAVGTGPRRVVLGFMVATAFLSMWISNTATAALMLPIGIAVAELFRPEGEDEGPYGLGTALMLGIAYAASIGGVATLIGTPANAVLAGAASEMLGIEVGFSQWMILGLPITMLLIPVTWLLLVRVLHPPGALDADAGALLAERHRSLGPLSRGERTVAVVFVLTAAAWIMRAPKDLGWVTIPGLQTWLPGVRDSTVAMAAALVLFLTPVSWSGGRFALDWQHARRIPWGVLVLFGGGLSLARAMDASGLAAWIGGAVSGLAGVPPIVLFGVVALLFIFLTEVTSNTATSTMAMPIMAGAAVGLAVDPLTLMAAAALSASMAFMLPVATPPNAIVFGSGQLTIRQMVRAGVVMNLLSALVIVAALTLLAPLAFG